MTVDNWPPDQLKCNPRHGVKSPARLGFSAVMFYEDQAQPLIDWTEWHPFISTHHPKELCQPTGWSLDNLHEFAFFEDREYPSTFWQFLSECPNLTSLALHAFHIHRFLPVLCQDTTAIPFPSLRCLTVSRRVYGIEREPAPVKDLKDYTESLGSLFQTLSSHRSVRSKHRPEQEWVLDKLVLESFPFVDPMRRLTQLARDHGVAKELCYPAY
ncbi:hypothetical protein NMY22_g16671 [Coprinellus aureogranulatus]|nr:hypothetical protein NMY22_g16671 [Coprinellus aureogranulatus]